MWEEATIKELNEKPWRMQGKDNSLWIAIDYVDVMVTRLPERNARLLPPRDLGADAPATRYDSEY